MKEKIWTLIVQNEPSIVPISMVIIGMQFLINCCCGHISLLSDEGCYAGFEAIN